MSFAPPTPVPPRPPSPPPVSKRADKANWIIGSVICALVAVGAVVAVVTSRDDDKPSGPGQTVCELLADPSNDTLTTRDIARLADMSTTELRNYVHRRCPENDFRVD